MTAAEQAHSERVRVTGALPKEDTVTTALIGATGRVGSENVRGVLARGEPATALVRYPDKSPPQLRRTRRAAPPLLGTRYTARGEVGRRFFSRRKQIFGGENQLF